MSTRPSRLRPFWALVAIVATASALVVPPRMAAALPVTVLTDGFESAAMSGWSPVQAVTVQKTEHHAGTYGARATSTGAPAFAQRALPASTADVTVAAWFKIVSISTEASVLVVRTASGPLLTLALAKTRRLLTRNAVSGGSVTSTTAPTAGVWHQLQLRAAIGSNGQVEVWLDGAKVTVLSKTQNLGSGRITAIQIGGTDTSRKYDLVFDDVAVSVPDTTAPSVPTGVTATSTAPRDVTVTWSASSDDVGVTSYAIVRDGTQIGTVNGTTLRYVDSGLASAHTYRYTVAAIDGTGNRSAASAAATVSTPDSQAPTVPTGVTATSTAPRDVTVTWSASSDDVGVTSYAIVRDGTQIGTVNGTTLRYVDSGLASAHTYRYTVAAIDGTGNRSAASAAATVSTPDSQAPTVPTGVTATSTAPRDVTVTWSASSDDVGVTSYAIVRDGTQIGTVNGTTLRYVDSGLASAHTYRYTVAAIDGTGNRSAASAAATVSTPDSQAPTVPQDVSANASGSLQVTVTWSASSDDVGVTSYAIVRDGTQIGTVNGSTLSYIDRGVASGQHTYSVAALDAAGNRSNPSATAGANAADSQAPTVPQDVSANASGSLQVTVTWSASSDDVGVTSYAIVRDGTQIGTVNGTTLRYVDSGLASAHTYRYTVAAIDGTGNRSAASAAATVSTPDSQAPTVPQDVSANASGSLQVTVTWSASSDDVGVTSYAIVRDGTQIGTVNGTTLSYIDRGVASGQHTYSVAALDAAGNRSNPSATAGANAADSQAPGSPTLASATPTEFDGVALTWTAVIDDVGVAGYGIYRGDVLVATVDGATTTYEDTGLAGSSTYTYRIDAFDAAGNRSAPSAPLDATTPAAPDHDPPSAPAHLAATATGPRAVDLEWTQSFDNIGVASYRVLRNGSTIATVTADPNPFADGTYHDGSVSPNTSYTYRVVALDATGNVSDPSDPESVTTPLDPDTQPPTPPGALQASAAQPTEVDLTWTAATDDRLLGGYRVVRDGQLLAVLGSEATSYADTSTDPSTHYAYGVQALDAAGNVSTAAAASVTTPALPCNTAGGALPSTTSATYRAFDPGSIWNAQIRSAPVDCNSDAMSAWLRGDSGSNYIRLAGSTSDGTWGNPIYWSTEDDPAFAVTNTCTVAMPPEFQAIRIPITAQPDDSTDAAMTVYDLATGVVAAFHHTVKTVASDGSVSWSACGGAAYHLDSNGLDGRAGGADDARNGGHRGVPPPTYAVRWDEIQSGSIDHALKIAINNTCDHVWPMVGDEGCNGGGLIPEGTRIRIRPGVDLSTYALSPAALVIARALQRYGAYVGDQSGGGVALKVENTVAEGRGYLWNGVLDPRSLSAIPLSAYEVVKRGWGAP